MLRLLLVFLITFAGVYGSIELFRSLTKKEKLALTKQAAYSTIVAVVTLLLLTLIVIVF